MLCTNKEHIKKKIPVVITGFAAVMCHIPFESLLPTVKKYGFNSLCQKIFKGTALDKYSKLKNIF